MKYKKFVNEKNLVLTQQEKDFFYQYFMNMVYNNNLPLTFDKMEQTDKNNYIFNFIANKDIKGRNKDNERITKFTNLFVVINKSSGYLDATDWLKDNELKKDYDNAPQFQYNVVVNINGNYIPYRCKKTKQIHIPNMYQYGTEFTDINYNEYFNILSNKLNVK